MRAALIVCTVLVILIGVYAQPVIKDAQAVAAMCQTREVAPETHAATTPRKKTCAHCRRGP